MVVVYVALTFAGTIAVAHAVTGVLPEHPVRGFCSLTFECLCPHRHVLPGHALLDAHRRRLRRSASRAWRSWADGWSR